jgi:TonB-dependent receptor
MFRTSARFIRTFASTALVVCVAAPFAQAGTVSGRVLDSTTSLPLAGVEVLVDGVPTGVTTDFMGQFKAEVAGGDRLFTFRRSGFSEQSQGPLPVGAEGESTVPDAKLTPVSVDDDIVMLDALTVSSDVVKGSAGDLQNTRLKADVAIDFLSADEFAKFGAGDIAESLIRVPGVSVANGQFAVIRGLSDRYTSTSLSGLKIPSPDPEKQSPQLDVLPTSLVETLVVSKTFSSNLWAESSGGAIDLTPKSFPEERKITVSIGTKANENAVRDGGPVYDIPDKRNDLFANGSDSRPGERPVTSNGRHWSEPVDFSVAPGSDLPIGSRMSATYGETFIWNDRKLGVNVAGGWERGSKSQSGRSKRLYLKENNGRPLSESDYLRGVSTQPGLSTYDFESSEVEVSMNLLANVAFEINRENSLRATSFYTRTGTDFASYGESPLEEYIGSDGNLYIVGADISDPDAGEPQSIQKFRSSQRYTERELLMNQVGGDHTFTQLHDLELTWAAQLAETSQNEPGVTQATYYEQLGVNPPAASVDFAIPVGRVGIAPSSPALYRSWSFTEEKQTAERIDLTLPVEVFREQESKLRAGVAREDTDRSYRGKSDFYRANDASLTLDERTLPAGSDVSPIFNRLLTDTSGNFIQASEPNFTTQSRDLLAGYLGADIALPKRFKVNVGARLEDFSISTAGRDEINPYTTGLLYHRTLFGVFGTERIARLNGDDVATRAHITRVNFEEQSLYPAIGLVYQPRDKVNVRLNFSETTARPSLRELGPYFNRSLETGDYVLGNPALKTSEVKNYDLRLEWLPSTQTMVAASVFAKTIADPIEKIYLPDAVNPDSLETWVNNPNQAELLGTEFEVRFGLGVLTEALENFSVGGNVTYINAVVEETPFAVDALEQQNLIATGTQIERRLYDQPEWLGNFDVTWNQRRWGTTATLAFNYSGDVLYAAAAGAPTAGGRSSFDLYTRSTHRVDFSLSQKLTKTLKLRFGVKNLTDPERGTIYDPERTAGEIVRSEFKSGREYSVSLSAEF